MPDANAKIHGLPPKSYFYPRSNEMLVARIISLTGRWWVINSARRERRWFTSASQRVTGAARARRATAVMIEYVLYIWWWRFRRYDALNGDTQRRVRVMLPRMWCLCYHDHFATLFKAPVADVICCRRGACYLSNITMDFAMPAIIMRRRKEKISDESIASEATTTRHAWLVQSFWWLKRRVSLAILSRLARSYATAFTYYKKIRIYFTEKTSRQGDIYIIAITL